MSIHYFQQYMLFAGLGSVRIEKNCDRGLENAARGRKSVSNLTKALPWPVGRYRRILPTLTTNQNAGFVTVRNEKKR